MDANRLYFIDWMKVLGMYCIVAGHFFPPYNTFLYTFSVPLFFFVSGYLCRPQSVLNFWVKLFRGLIVPMLLFFIILNALLIAAKGIDNRGGYGNLLYLGLIGEQNALGAMWFVYTLCIVKVLFQYVQSIKINIILSVCFLVLAYYINQRDIYIANAWVNVLLAHPFFLFGIIVKKTGVLEKEISHTTLMLLLAISFTIVGIVTYYNGWVAFYLCAYGKSLWLFLIGSIGGILLVYGLGKLLDKFHLDWMNHLSQGMIAILGLHIFFIQAIRILPFYETSLLDYLYSAMIMALFVPIIRLLATYFPILLGARKLK